MHSENYGSCQIHSPKISLNKTCYQASDDYERISPEKQKQRLKVLGFILDNVDSDIKYTGLPGKYWRLETELAKRCTRARFSGFEKNQTIYHNSKFIMPGRHNVISKSKNIDPSKQIDIHVNNRSVYVLGGIRDLTDTKTHKLFSEISGTFKYGFTKINAIWYDFTSSFNEETYVSMYNIKNLLDSEVKSVICLTFLYGRDLYFNGSGEEARIDIVKRALPNFIPLDYWKYKGFNNSTMMTICGIVNPEPN